MIEFRNLRPEEIQVRVNNVTAKGATYLLYKDARCDMDILDETVGSENWQRDHTENKGNLFCRVGININWESPTAPQEWCWKQDCGTESNTEKEKGEASDSFKRACVNWGIGRELYTKIQIFIRVETVDTGKKKPNGQPIYALKNPYEQFKVSDIEYEGKKITYIRLCDKNGITAFEWGKRKKTVDDAAKIVEQMFPTERCVACGKEIEEYLGKKGSVSIEKHCNGSIKKFGAVYCIDCINKGVPQDEDR